MEHCERCGRSLDPFERGLCADCVQRGKARARAMVRKYGITPEQRDAMLADQGGCCAVCRTPLGAGLDPYVDHSHESGRVRGILCPPCNFMLGHAADSPQRLRAGANYLERQR